MTVFSGERLWGISTTSTAIQMPFGKADLHLFSLEKRSVKRRLKVSVNCGAGGMAFTKCLAYPLWLLKKAN